MNGNNKNMNKKQSDTTPEDSGAVALPTLAYSHHKPTPSHHHLHPIPHLMLHHQGL